MTELPKRVRALNEAAWTAEEDALLVSRFQLSRTLPELARLHGREISAIRNRLCELGMITQGTAFPLRQSA